MDVDKGNATILTELNIEVFLRSVGNIVERLGLETFFYTKDTDGKMKYIPNDPQKPTFTSVLDEHEPKLMEHHRKVELNDNDSYHDKNYLYS